MPSPRDYLSDARWYLAKGRVRVSNAWYRAVGERVQAARTGFRNRRNARTIGNLVDSLMNSHKIAVASKIAGVRSAYKIV